MDISPKVERYHRLKRYLFDVAWKYFTGHLLVEINRPERTRGVIFLENSQ